ncbi:AAA family ATPase [Corynebacterium pseudotuberculosis]|uniref:AAA family ATPase n=1 Tax=Corynebacterium pseudotuberculosis 258 TaxID=1168865 RepID=A0AAX1FKA4_CORPS|nr:AAA family ATPase [Corynebacterium pseudotuberculosis]AMN70499.1 AAA family ATPase [Corynebacterium pseudotuberculosis]AMN72350.1 hypothetical protein ATN03_08195 [Corynebacterium pseudotuberculosis]AMN73796.1 hypothetical protein ATN04_05160 [Corynebacterium pseudotuberculosis]AMN75459.1 hypothetical protein ATN05_03430 [Corynebacterium pseudotuberculosis]ANZ91605.1 hypothetical protein CPMB20_03430 [Corynebacterium pseudotuberculosis]
MTIEAYTDQEIQQLVDDHFASLTPRPSAREILERFDGDLNEWVYPGFVCDSYTMFVGKPKQGKSLLAVNLATAVSRGESFLGVSPSKPMPGGSVVILTTEANGLTENVRRLDETGADMDNVFIHRIGADGVPEDVYTACEGGVIDLVIIDNVVGVCRGVDINKPEAVSALTSVAERINLAGVPVVFIHHYGKGGNHPGHSPMGNTGIVGLMRHIVGIEKSKGIVKLRTEGNVGEPANHTIRFNKHGKAVPVEGNRPEAPKIDETMSAMARFAREAPASSKTKAYEYVVERMNCAGLTNARGKAFTSPTVKAKIEGMVKSESSTLRWDTDARRYV